MIASFTTFKSINFRYDLQAISVGYLGETTERKDDIFKGVSGTLEMDVQDPEYLYFLDFLMKRAQRKLDLASSRVNVTASFNFPSGATPKLLIRGLAFDASELASSGRDAYVGLSLPYQSEEPRLIAA